VDFWADQEKGGSQVPNWIQLQDYVHANYKVDDETPTMMRLLFKVGAVRSQYVFIWKQQLQGDSEDWAQIESPIGPIANIDLTAALDATSNIIVGGLAQTSDMLVLRHTVPLSDLAASEFEKPLQLIVSTADELESVLVGGDTY